MADHSTLARPYAKAVFELAEAGGRLEEWGVLLKALAAAVDHERVRDLLHDPRVGGARIGQVVVEALGERVNQQERNFIRLLAENGRLRAAADIAADYEARRAEAERIVDVSVTSAAPLTDELRERFTAALRQRLDREIRLHCEVDETLIGGAVVRSGDLVIDSSLRGRLRQLATNLNN